MTNPPVDVSIVIVNWNSSDYVQACVGSILEYTQGVRHEIIVVDSGSYDGCGEMLATQFPQVRFVQCPDNVGFGRANNLGVQHARAKRLLLLNPDTELRSDAISALCAKLDGCPHACRAMKEGHR
jgi:GT2 family glycosyltransferase